MKNFKNEKILVTGHTGFKGSWLCKILNLEGARVIGLSNRVEDYHLCYKNLGSNIFYKEIFENAENADFSTIIKKNKIDIVFYLAAQALVPSAFLDPHRTIISNVAGASKFLESLKTIDRDIAVVFVTSDKVYENNEWIYGYRENDKLGGIDPYSASKTAAEIIIRSYYECFLRTKSNISFGIARAGNVIGGGDFSPGRIIPDAINAIKKNKTLFVKNPRSTRPWQHVLEPLNGYLNLAKRLKLKQLDGEIFNFGPNLSDNLSVLSLLNLLKKKLPDLNFDTLASKSDIVEHELLYLDTTKAKKILNWKPKMTIENSITLLADWYRTYLDETERLEKIMEEQIENYWNL